MTSRTLPKKTRLSREDRLDHILEAAAELFSQYGYQGTTTKAIALNCNINESLIYRHFPTKRDLYEALLDQILYHWRDEILPAFMACDDLPLEQALVKICQAVVDQFHDDPRLIRMMLYSSLESPEYAKNFFQKELPINKFLENFLQKRKSRGELNSTDVPLLAKTFLALIFQHLTIKEIYQSPTYFSHPETEVIQFFVKTLLNGVEA